MAKYKELVVISGKGGSGKTTVAAGLASLFAPVVAADYDVDAANLHLALRARPLESGVFMAGWEPRVDRERCTGCGVCTGACRFQAMAAGRIADAFACEGCGACALVCPEGAVRMVESEAGTWIRARAGTGPVIYADLGPGRENSGKLVAKVKDLAKETAGSGDYRLLIGDGPPGIACAAIAAISRADAVLIVAEPGLTGQHDLGRAVELCWHFQIKPLVCLNKYDLWPEGSRQVEAYCREQGLIIAGRMPWCDSVHAAAQSGTTVAETGSAAVKKALGALAAEIRRIMAV